MNTFKFYIQALVLFVLTANNLWVEGQETPNSLVLKLNNKDFRIRLEAIENLGKTKLEDKEIERLSYIAEDDENFWVRIAAIEELGNVEVQNLSEIRQNDIRSALSFACATRNWLEKIYAEATVCKIFPEGVSLTGIFMTRGPDFPDTADEAMLLIRSLNNLDKEDFYIIKQLTIFGKNAYSTDKYKNILKKITPMATPHLSYALYNKNWEIRAIAVELLGYMESAQIFIPNFIVMLDDKNWQVRVNTLLTLSRMEIKAALVPEVLKTLQDKDIRVRIVALKSLGRIATKNHTLNIVPPIISALNDEDWRIRVAAIRTLITLKAKAQFAIPILLKFKEGNYLEEEMYIKALIEISCPDGKKSKEGFEKLSVGLRSEEWLIVKRAIQALINTTYWETTIPVLIKTLHKGDQAANMFVVEMLESVAELGKMELAISTLASELKYSNNELREEIAETIAFLVTYKTDISQISIELLVEALQDDLQDDDKRVRSHIATVLGRKLVRLPPVTFSTLDKELQRIYTYNFLRSVYKIGEKNLIDLEYLQFLATSGKRKDFCIVAVVSAWLGNKKKAQYYLAKSLCRYNTCECKKQVRFLLEGKSPKEVEEVINKK